MTSHYDILGISRTASDDEVKSAYIKKAKIFHPDVMKNNNLNNDLSTQWCEPLKKCVLVKDFKNVCKCNLTSMNFNYDEK